jgi:ubiquinone/menaquinone biosynthesis C-methylase UbiE
LSIIKKKEGVTMNTIAQQFDTYRDTISRKMVKLSSVKSADKIIDLCTGTARIPQFINQYHKGDFQIYAVDNDQSCIKKNQTLDIPKTIFIYKDVDEFKFPKNQLTFCSLGLMYLKKPQNLVSKVHHSLDHHGEFIISIWDSFGPENIYERIRTVIAKTLRIDNQSVNSSPVLPYQSLLSKYFTNISEESICQSIIYPSYETFIDLLIERELNYLPTEVKHTLLLNLLELYPHSGDFHEESSVRIIVAKNGVSL